MFRPAILKVLFRLAPMILTCVYGAAPQVVRVKEIFPKPVAFAPDGKTLASRSEENTVKLWDVATGEEIRTLSGHTDSVR
jgi:WD40 repeat protein